MHHSLRFALFAAACAAVLSACARPDAPARETATAPAENGGAAADDIAFAKGDSCSLVSQGEVRAAFPGAEPGKRDRTQESYGIATCTWALPANTLVIQTFEAEGAVRDDLRDRMMGFLDPLRPALQEQVQYHAIAGLADEAVAVAVKADAAQGILADAAMLGIRRGSQVAVLFIARLVDGDPEASRQALQSLGRRAAARL